MSQLTDFRRAELTEAFAPGVKGRFGDAEFAPDLGDWRAALGLAQRSGDLLVEETGFAHGRTSSGVGVRRIFLEIRGVRFGEKTPGLLGIEEVEDHFRAAHEIAVEESRGVSLDYFGSDYRLPPNRLSSAECESLFDQRSVAAAFMTPEVSIDPETLADMVRARISADSKIRCVLGAHVHAVESAEKPTVTFEMSGTSASEQYDHVVNCLWDGRLAIDRTAGLGPERPWLYRLEHYLRLRAPALAAAVPSVTIILGPFGTIAAYGTGDFYLSWYPASMRAMSSALSPPAWSLVRDEAASLQMRRSILAGLARVVPSVGRLTPETIEFCQVKGGIAFAWGKSDIDDPASGLHERHAIGPVSRGRYHTIDTGKLTMAPLFGKLVADRIRQIG